MTTSSTGGALQDADAQREAADHVEERAPAAQEDRTPRARDRRRQGRTEQGVQDQVPDGNGQTGLRHLLPHPQGTSASPLPYGWHQSQTVTSMTAMSRRQSQTVTSTTAMSQTVTLMTAMSLRHSQTVTKMTAMSLRHSQTVTSTTAMSLHAVQRTCRSAWKCLTLFFFVFTSERWRPSRR